MKNIKYQERKEREILIRHWLCLDDNDENRKRRSIAMFIVKEKKKKKKVKKERQKGQALNVDHVSLKLSVTCHVYPMRVRGCMHVLVYVYV